jgi:hypothetical protein
MKNRMKKVLNGIRAMVDGQVLSWLIVGPLAYPFLGCGLVAWIATPTIVGLGLSARLLWSEHKAGKSAPTRPTPQKRLRSTYRPPKIGSVKFGAVYALD